MKLYGLVDGKFEWAAMSPREQEIVVALGTQWIAENAMMYTGIDGLGEYAEIDLEELFLTHREEQSGFAQ